jgi:alanine racemase
MRRLGIDPADCARALAMLGASPVLAISHFTSSEYPDAPANAAQIEAFAALAAQLPNIRLSLCNSSGIFLSQPPVHQLTRPGVALYGGNPTPHLKNPMQPVVSLHAPILLTREAPVGAVVGYNGVWTARRPTRIAIVGIGYADGLLRSAMGTDDRPGPKVMVGDVACHIIGRISMDLTAIDVTDAAPEHARRGARVEFFGSRLSVDDLAASAGTISYEILTGLSKRYARVYSGA